MRMTCSSRIWIFVTWLSFVHVISGSASTKLTLVAPNVLHYAGTEKVAVMCDGQCGDIDVYLEAWPGREREFSKTTKAVSTGSAVEFEVTVAFDDLNPDLNTVAADVRDTLALSEKRYVYLVARKSGTDISKEVRVLLSKTVGNIFLQTDKPVYTPNQQVKVAVYSTDLRNMPQKMPLRVDIMTPKGIVVDRQDKESEHKDPMTGELIAGVFMYTFSIGLKPVLGNWSVTAYTGPAARDGTQYIQSTSVAFEVEEYVLPTFECSISNVPEYIRESDTSKSITVTARYSHGKPVKGSISVRFGIADDGKASYITRQRASVANGRHEFQLTMRDMYDQEPYFRFSSRAAGKYLFIEAACTEQSSGEQKESISMSAMFVSSPYTVHFERSPRSFKPGLPLVFQFELKHANGRVAANTAVKISMEMRRRGGAQAITHSTLDGSGSSSTITTDRHGIGRAMFTVQSDIDSANVVIEQVSGENIGRLYMGKIVKAHDLVINVQHKIFSVNETIDVNLHSKGGPFSSIVWLVVSKGQIISAGKTKGRYSGYQLLKVPVSATMIPNARLLVYMVAGSQVAADSAWIDLHDVCTSGLSVSTDKTQYEVKDGTGNLEVNGSPSSYVMVQMVDQAVFMLNSARSLTPAKMFSTLADLDLGCPTVRGETASETFRQAGLVISSHHRQVQNNAHINAGLRLDETGCGGDDFRLESDCCNYGKKEPVSESCTSLERKFVTRMQPSEQCLLVYRECCTNNTARIVRPPIRVHAHRRFRVMSVPFSARDVSRSKSRHLFKSVGHELGGSGGPVMMNGMHGMRSMAGMPGMRSMAGMPDMPGPQPDFSARDMYDINMNIQEAGIRRNFPESVILGPIKLTPDGEKVTSFDLPDSITSWSVEAVELSDRSGMCVAPPHSFTVSKKYFLKLKLPYKAVRKEQLMLHATFYNEERALVTVHIMMRGVEGVCSKATPGEFTVHTRTVEANSAVTVSWPIVPLKHGVFPIEVVAMKNGLEILDAVQRTLTVVPEGVSSSHSESFVLEPSSRSAKPAQCDVAGVNHLRCHLDLSLPQKYVPNSASGRVSITGNTFGPAVELVLGGLANKLRMPSGCGEQVMIHTSPGVYAYNYMMETSTLTSDVEEKFPAIVKDGVNRILAYLKDNGGIGVWTTSPASTWLTSFVLKVFAKASQFHGGAVDQHLLERAVHFLYSMQHTSGATNGRFREYSSVSRHHGEMIGAVKDSDLTLTAFIMIALMEADSPLQVHKDNYQRSLTYLGNNVAQSQTAYEAALVAYALSKSSYKTQAFNKLKEFASVQELEDLRIRYFPGPSGTAKKIEVETAAYGILTALNNGDVDYCYDIVLWLHQQRKNDGIFQSTQDTVVALQALSEYAAVTRDRSATNLHVKISLSTGSSTRSHSAGHSMEFDIGEDDKNREFIFNIKEDNVEEMTSAIVDVSGLGVAQLTMQTLFNLQEEKSCTFDIDIRQELQTVTSEPNGISDYDLTGDDDSASALEMTLTVCAKHRNSNPTEMAIMDIGLLTGFQALTKSLQEHIDQGVIDFFEISDKSVVVYLPSISHEREVCVTLKALQSDPVANMSPAPVRVYDYYNRESECSTFYALDNSEPWELDFNQDKCYEGACPKCYGPEGDEPWTLQQFRQIICTPQVTFILKAEYVRSRETESWTIFYMKVLMVMKEGLYPMPLGVEVEVARYKTCTCPDITTAGQNYVILGKEEALVDTGTGEAIIRLTLDQDAYVEPWGRGGSHRDLRNYMRESNPCPL